VMARGERNPIECRADLGEIRPSCFGQHNTSVQAPEHRSPKPLLEQLDVAADGAVRHMKFRRCLIEAAEACGRFEGFK
jgi:hypothetical protein